MNCSSKIAQKYNTLFCIKQIYSYKILIQLINAVSVEVYYLFTIYFFLRHGHANVVVEVGVVTI